MKTPKTGDKQVIGKCELCGGTEYEVYSGKKGYGDDFNPYWRQDCHKYNLERDLCIIHLASRIEALEPKKRGKK
jgi:hypothetical protein